MNQLSNSQGPTNNQHYIFLFNPISGTKNKLGVEKLIHKSFEGYSYEYYKTNYPGHASEISAKYCNDSKNIVVAVGGDGTINEIAQNLVRKPAKLGIIPIGSGNGFAGHIFKSKKIDSCIANLKSNQVIQCDVLLINNQVCCNTCGIGLSGYVAKFFNEKGSRGLYNYFKLGLSKFKSFEAFEFLLNTQLQHKIINLEIANSSQLGNNAYISPNSSTYDGQAELVFLEKPTLIQVPTLIYDVFNKKLHHNRLVNILSTTHGDIELKMNNHFHIDGEYKGLIKNIHFEVLTSALNILV